MVKYIPEKCAFCNGSGVSGNTTCPSCGGNGSVLVALPATQCEFCNGTGYDENSIACSSCSGTGWKNVLLEIDADNL